MAFTALLDTNVLWSAAVRDTLLRAAKRGLYRPAWTEDILGELARSLKRQRPDLDPARLDRMVGLIRQSFPAALVEGYEELIPVMRNHEGDRHVLAAAVRVGAGAIVTSNRDHFPPYACDPYTIDVQTPDEFLCHLWHLSPEEMIAILEEQAAALSHPPMTPQQVVATLSRSVPTFARQVLQSGKL
jgi:predicted nucleic acid-binding protein